jgi:hypothetical protein
MFRTQCWMIFRFSENLKGITLSIKNTIYIITIDIIHNVFGIMWTFRWAGKKFPVIREIEKFFSWSDITCCVIWDWKVLIMVWFMVLNATFNNMSVISWREILLMEETGDPEKTTDISQVTQKLITYCCIAWVRFDLSTLVVKGADCTGSCKSNYRSDMHWYHRYRWI